MHLQEILQLGRPCQTRRRRRLLALWARLAADAMPNLLHYCLLMKVH